MSMKISVVGPIRGRYESTIRMINGFVNQAYNIDNVEFKKMDLNDIDFDFYNEFDTVFCSGVLHHMVNSEEVAAFQFRIDGITEITNASGGTSETNNFDVVFWGNAYQGSSATKLYGSSFSDNIIPPGSGTLVKVAFEGIHENYSEICLQTVIITDSQANEIVYEKNCYDIP